MKKVSCICNGGRNPVAGSQEKVSGVAVLGCCANWVITDPVYGSFPFACVDAGNGKRHDEQNRE